MATIASEIIVKIDDLPPDMVEPIKASLTLPNEDREKAEKIKQFGFWDMPATIELWREERRRGGDHVLCLPRGFAAQLVAGLAAAGAKISWDDRRSSAPMADGYCAPFALRSYQWPFVADLLLAEQGVGMAPTASGKTVSLLGLVALAQQRAIVIVDKESLAEQWRERACRFLDLSSDLGDERSVGKIGKGVWEERDLTICLRQTLFSRLLETDAVDWGRRWGVCIIDEVHHLGSAESLQEVVRALPCRIMIGASAMPARTETQGLVTGAIVGPIVARVDNDALVREGIVVRPSVRVVPTSFQADFWPDHDSDPAGKCLKPGCKKSSAHSHRNNYTTALSRLLKDHARNSLVAREIARERGHYHLVASRQKNVLDLLRVELVEAGWPEEKIWYLRGAENADGLSVQIADQVDESDEAVVLSTVADEGLDIRRLDRVHVVFPMRQEAATMQLVGRATRSAPGKDSAVVVDYHDRLVGVFDEQHRDRASAYRSLGLPLAAASGPRDFIEWWSFPELNALWYMHVGCDGTYSTWCDPLDDCEPSIDATDECRSCFTTRSVSERPRSREARFVICGSRGWEDAGMISEYVKQLRDWSVVDRSWPVVIQGGASGADTIACREAMRMGVEVRQVEADWSIGPSAGVRRNVEMIDMLPHRVAAFSLGTPGTRHVVDEARRRGIPVDLHGPGGIVEEDEGRS